MKTLTRNKKRSFFTLLEVMIAMSLLAIAGSVMGVKFHQKLEEKRFSAAIDKIVLRLVNCQYLSRNMQRDLTICVKTTSGRTEVSEVSVQGLNKFFLDVLTLDGLQFILNQKEVDSIRFDFYSSGQVAPEGILVICNSRGSEKKLNLCDIFSYTTGEKLVSPFSGEEKVRAKVGI